MTNNNNPWAGLASYEDPSKSERKLKFCGRDNDIYDVTRLIDDNLLLILYGKSGIGKTSLLNAGVFPKLRLEQYLPVSIRLGALETTASYQEAIISVVEDAIEEVHGSITVFNVVEEQTDNQQPDLLWNYFSRHRFANSEQQPLFPVVVLDQFEEVLRNTTSEHVGKAQTLLNQLQYLIDENHALNDCVVDSQEYFYDFNFRFVISIREDELYLLEDNIDDLSLSVFRNCRYRLRSLSEQGATKVILVPGKDCIAEEEKQSVVGRVIELSKRPQSNDIDTLLLSLVCAGTYDKKAGDKIMLSDLAVWRNNPMEVYYQDAVKELTANQVQYIQQHLIRDDGSRKRVNANEVKAAVGESTYYTLTQSENRMLVLEKHGQVELLHDQLALAVYKERNVFEEKKKKRKLRQRQASIVGVVFLLGVLGIFARQNYKMQILRWETLETQSRYIAEKAETLIQEDSYLARLLLLEVLPIDLTHPNRPYTQEAENALRHASVHYSAILSKDSVVKSAIFSPNGKYIASTSDEHHKIMIWDAEIGTIIHSLSGHLDCINSLAFSPDSRTIVSAADRTIQVWNCHSGMLLQTLKKHSAPVNSISFCPNGELLASASDDSTIVLWETKTWIPVRTITGHHSGINTISFNNENQIISASKDSTVKIWDTNTGKELSSIKHEGMVKSAFYSPQGDYIVSIFTKTQSDTTRAILHEQTETTIIEFSEAKSKEYDYHLNYYIDSSYDYIDCAYSPDGNRLAFLDNHNSLFLYDNVENIVKGPKYTYTLETGLHTIKNDPIYTIEGITSHITSTSFSPNGKSIVATSNNGKLRIWDAELSSDIRVLNGHEKWVNSVNFSMDGKLIVSASGDNTIKIWDASTGIQLRSIDNQNIVVCHAVFSPDGDRIVSASADGNLRIWNYNTGELIQTLIGHEKAALYATFSHDGKQIVSTSCDNTIIIWDAENYEYLNCLEGHNENVNSANFSPDGSLIVSASSDNTIIVWDVKTNKPLHTFQGHKGPVNEAVFSPDGKYIASASEDNTIIIWDYENDSILHTIERNYFFPWVNSVAFSPDGKSVISAAMDNRITIWDIETAEALHSVYAGDAVLFSCSYNHDGKCIAMAFNDGTIRIWDFPPLQDLIDRTRERFKNRPLTDEERRMYYLE